MLFFSEDLHIGKEDSSLLMTLLTMIIKISSLLLFRLIYIILGVVGYGN